MRSSSPCREEPRQSSLSLAVSTSKGQTVGVVEVGERRRAVRTMRKGREERGEIVSGC